MSIKKIFDEISSDNGSNKKMEILSKYENDQLLKRVLYLANSRKVKFYIKQIPSYSPSGVELPLEQTLADLGNLSSRRITGNDAISYLKWILSNSSPDDAYIIERIIEKDCKIGMGTININKIFPDLIEDTPYMGAKPFSKDLVLKLLEKGPAYSQMKMDGRYCNAIVRFGEVELESRQGETTYLRDTVFCQELASFPNCVLNGELTMDGKTRYESNGIISSIVMMNDKKAKGEDIKKDILKFEKENKMTIEDALIRIRYTIWDTISVEEYFAKKSSTPYQKRLQNVKDYINSTSPVRVSVVESVTVNTYAEAMAHFQTMINQGNEGTVLKAINGVWKDGKPIWQIKLKLEIDMELRIIGFNYGTGKNANVISSVDCESEDGILKTSPTGIKEEEMKRITDNQKELMGKILKVKCSGISRDKLGAYSVLHPVYRGIRDDKDTADNLQQILDIEAMAKGLK